MNTVRRYTAEQFAKESEWEGYKLAREHIPAMLRQAANATTRLQSLEAEVARLREALQEAVEWMDTVEPELFRMDGGDRFDGAPLTIARNALKEG